MSDNIKNKLFEMCGEEYKAFHSRLIPGVAPHKIIGVRTTALRKFVKQLNESGADEFMRSLPREYYDENNVHALLIEQIKDYDECAKALDLFLSTENYNLGFTIKQFKRLRKAIG